MTDATLRDLVVKRLEAETQPEDEWSALVRRWPEPRHPRRTPRRRVGSSSAPANRQRGAPATR